MVPRSGIGLAVTLALIVLAQQSREAAIAEARQTGRGFSVDGLVLGMDLAEFKTAYPAAPIIVHKAIRYCYGRASLLDQLNWASAVSANGDVSVRATFRQLDNRLQLTNLVRTEVIDIQTTEFRSLRDLRNRMMREHGPSTRLLVRRKREPAGRIVGFEWSRPEEQSLSVAVHEDHAHESSEILVTTRLTNALPGMHAARAMAARGRAVIEAFRQECQTFLPKR